jgi:hypothetical protein
MYTHIHSHACSNLVHTYPYSQEHRDRLDGVHKINLSNEEQTYMYIHAYIPKHAHTYACSQEHTDRLECAHKIDLSNEAQTYMYIHACILRHAVILCTHTHIHRSTEIGLTAYTRSISPMRSKYRLRTCITAETLSVSASTWPVVCFQNTRNSTGKTCIYMYMYVYVCIYTHTHRHKPIFIYILM